MNQVFRGVLDMKRIIALLFIIILVSDAVADIIDAERDKSIMELFTRAQLSIETFSKNKDRNELLKATECTDKALQLAREPVSEALDQVAEASKHHDQILLHGNEQIVVLQYGLFKMRRQAGCLRYKGIADMFAIVGDKDKAKALYRFIIENFDKKDYHQCATSAEFGLEDLKAAK